MALTGGGNQRRLYYKGDFFQLPSSPSTGWGVVPSCTFRLLRMVQNTLPCHESPQHFTASNDQKHGSSPRFWESGFGGSLTGWPWPGVSHEVWGVGCQRLKRHFQDGVFEGFWTQFQCMCWGHTPPASTSPTPAGRPTPQPRHCPERHQMARDKGSVPRTAPRPQTPAPSADRSRVSGLLAADRRLPRPHLRGSRDPHSRLAVYQRM